MNFKFTTNLKNIDANHEMQRNSGHIVNLSESAKLFSCVHLTILLTNYIFC